MLADFIFALIIALVITLLIPTRRSSDGTPDEEAGSLAAGFIMLLILFPIIWAGGLWITPIGAPLWGSYWLSFVLVGAFAALLILAAAPPPPHRKRPEMASAREAERSQNAVAAFGIFIWILLLASLAAVFISYVVLEPPMLQA